VLGCALLADRARIGVATGGRGALALLAVAAPLAAIMTVARYGARRSLGFMASPTFVFFVLPYLVLSGLLPALGVMFNGYPERTLFSITGPTTAISLLVLGAAISSGERSWSRWLLLAIAVQLAYATGQAVYLSRGPGWELFAPLHQWDLSMEALSGEFVQARGSGLYFNPNELGLWAGMAIILAWTLLSSSLRPAGVILAALTLVLSQSRGALVALVAALAAGALYTVARDRVSLSWAFRTVVVFAIAVLLALVVAFMIDPSGAVLERFGALFDVWARGPTADPNLAGRIDLWSAVWALNLSYPWGTLGPPGLLLGTSIDSEWFQALAQGSVLYVGSLVLLVVGALSIGPFRERSALRLITVLVVVAGLTQTPFSYPAIVLFWVLVGAGLQSSVAARVWAQELAPARSGIDLAAAAEASGGPPVGAGARSVARWPPR